MIGESMAEAVAGLLEVTASEHPRLLDFQLHTILNSAARSAAHDLASAFGVPQERLGETVYRACADLGRLERRRGSWRDPTKVLVAPNLAALLSVCRARLKRAAEPARQQRLASILRRVEHAHGLARSRAWIEAFIGEPPARKAQGADG